jgi:hypothetical protein
VVKQVTGEDEVRADELVYEFTEAVAALEGPNPFVGARRIGGE